MGCEGERSKTQCLSCRGLLSEVLVQIVCARISYCVASLATPCHYSYTCCSSLHSPRLLAKLAIDSLPPPPTNFKHIEIPPGIACKEPSNKHPNKQSPCYPNVAPWQLQEASQPPARHKPLHSPPASPAACAPGSDLGPGPLGRPTASQTGDATAPGRLAVAPSWRRRLVGAVGLRKRTGRR